jgi:transcriptional regulator with XRE-family HTH domain
VVNKKISVYEAIRQIRKQKGISQEQVADYLEIDTTNYGRMERGQVAISVERLEKLASLYETSVTKILAMTTTEEIDSIEITYAKELVDELRKEVQYLKEQLNVKDTQITKLIDKINTH